MKTEHRTLREGEVLRPGDEAYDHGSQQWTTLKEGDMLVKGTVGRKCFGVYLPEGGFRRPTESQPE